MVLVVVVVFFRVVVFGCAGLRQWYFGFFVAKGNGRLVVVLRVVVRFVVVVVVVVVVVDVVVVVGFVLIIILLVVFSCFSCLMWPLSTKVNGSCKICRCLFGLFGRNRLKSASSFSVVVSHLASVVDDVVVGNVE